MSLKEKEEAFESIYIRIASCSQFFPYLIHPIILSFLIRPHSIWYRSKHPFLSVTLGQPRDVTLSLNNSTDSFSHMTIAI